MLQRVVATAVSWSLAFLARATAHLRSPAHLRVGPRFARLRLAARPLRGLAGCASAFGLLALGCGYTWIGGSGETGLGRVAVAMPENGSSHAGLEFVVADALRREVLRRAGAELVEPSELADWVVSGRVLPLRIAPASLSPVVLTLEYELTLALDLHARSPGGREVTGNAREFSETERFLTSADAEAQRKNRGEALRRVSRLLAERFLDRLEEEEPHGSERGSGSGT